MGMAIWTSCARSGLSPFQILLREGESWECVRLPTPENSGSLKAVRMVDLNLDWPKGFGLHNRDGGGEGRGRGDVPTGGSAHR